LSDRLVIGTRGSHLALWQTNWVKSNLEAQHPGIQVEVVTISTKGDRVLNVSLPKLGEQGKGLFTREIEEAMLDKRVDLAVHSLKDLPTDSTPDLAIGAICEREDVRDVLVARGGIDSFAALPARARLGTSSLRRSAQILAARDDLDIQPVRGNVDTRLRKLDEEQYDGIILAAAGVHRLGKAGRITEYLSENLVMSAIGQGAIAIQIRAGDESTNRLIRVLDHRPTRLACNAERAFLKGLGGGCLVPIAGLATLEREELSLAGLVASPDGKEIIKGRADGPAENAESIGLKLAEDLLRRGADRILNRH
jgi:hydroxymethylbilane synthase